MGGVRQFGELDSEIFRTLSWEGQSEITSWAAGPFDYPVELPATIRESYSGTTRVVRAGGRTARGVGALAGGHQGHRRPRRAPGAVALGGVPQLDHGGLARDHEYVHQRGGQQQVGAATASPPAAPASCAWGPASAGAGPAASCGWAAPASATGWGPASCGWAAPASRLFLGASQWVATRGQRAPAGRGQRVAIPGRQRAPPGRRQRTPPGRRQRVPAGRRQRARAWAAPANTAWAAASTAWPAARTAAIPPAPPPSELAQRRPGADLDGPASP